MYGPVIYKHTCITIWTKLICLKVHNITPVMCHYEWLCAVEYIYIYFFCAYYFPSALLGKLEAPLAMSFGQPLLNAVLWYILSACSRFLYRVTCYRENEFWLHWVKGHPDFRCLFRGAPGRRRSFRGSLLSYLHVIDREIPSLDISLWEKSLSLIPLMRPLFASLACLASTLKKDVSLATSFSPRISNMWLWRHSPSNSYFLSYLAYIRNIANEIFSDLSIFTSMKNIKYTIPCFLFCRWFLFLHSTQVLRDQASV